VSSFPHSMTPAFTLEQQRQIIEALNRKLRSCSACGMAGTWRLVTDGVISVPVTASLGFPGGYPAASGMYYAAPIYPNSSLPCVGVTCSNCGHLQLHSAIQLGLGYLVGVIPTVPLMSTEDE
jgi:hypothetical protein